MNQAATGPSSRPRDIGVVVIGRNEGERLRRCLHSIDTAEHPVVYVDSASTDGSVALARACGVEVVELDMSIPFTPSRARNVGFAELRRRFEGVRWVQFVDGDCELIAGWLSAARDFMSNRERVVAVRGRLRERFPERSIYNRLLDDAVELPDSEIDACGGIVMMRCDAFEASGGFRADLFVGEERELCRRLRLSDGQIWRINRAMAWHDLDMMHFHQWWRRTKRTGFSNAQGMHLFGADDRSVGRHVWRAVAWAAVLPAVILAATWAFGAAALVALLLYPLQVLRMTLSMSGRFSHRLASATFLMLGKFPELLGQIQFWTSRQPVVHARSFDKSQGSV